MRQYPLTATTDTGSFDKTTRALHADWLFLKCPGNPVLDGLIMKDDFTDVQNSYGRCLRNTRFIERFYEILMDSHPAMRPAFARTDMGQQRHALRRGISNAILYGGGYDLVQRTVESVAKIHSRKGHAPVAPNLYTYWMDSLIQAVREHDPKVTPELEARWRQAISPLIETFIQHY